MAFRRRQKGPLPFRYVLLLSFVFFILSTAGGVLIIDKRIEPILMSYAEVQTHEIANLVINKAINQKIIEENDFDNIIEITENDNGVKYAKLNPSAVNRIQGETQNLILMNLKEAEKGNLSDLESLTDVDIKMNKKDESSGMVFHVPLGQATNITLLGNLGPKIPVKFHTIGNARVKVKSSNKSYGINFGSFKAVIHVEVNVQVIIPFATKTTTIKQDILLGEVIIPGEVPQYYNNGGNSNPAVELPKPKNN
ncbi:sporulation protein YunB [Bacillus sp. V59.32b]|uniref:sporulation protein YunB n=1 Tax=Bacillus sp. V59.32b TaxID=1758642 RepID=UPI0020B175B8|nr:sporulation protein YunB [Bacillus sp. V59.32b]